MRKMIIILLVTLTTANTSFSTTFTITNSGFSFSPSNITINVGDQINFVLESVHTAREVSQATWNANGTTSNGGFDLPNGGGTVTFNQAGTYYYVCVPHASFGMKGIITVNTATDVKTTGETIPNNFILMQNYPNPFNPTTTISFSLPTKSFVSLKVYDVLGNEVAVLLSDELPAGKFERQWNAAELPSGVYFYSLKAGSFTSTKKLLLLK